jgi:hypothetical protein
MKGRSRGACVRCSRSRSGVALVSALALLTLAAALLAGSFASATALAQAERSERASVQAEALARRAAAEVLTVWEAGSDGLSVGAHQDTRTESSEPFGRTVVSTRMHRVSASLYAITADVRVGGGGWSGAPIAHRRCRLVAERVVNGGGAGVVGPLLPIARWSFAGIS